MICPVCGCAVSDSAMCANHTYAQDSEGDWAANNRAMCNYIHRGIIPQRLELPERPLEYDGVW